MSWLSCVKDDITCLHCLTWMWTSQYNRPFDTPAWRRAFQFPSSSASISCISFIIFGCCSSQQVNSTNMGPAKIILSIIGQDDSPKSYLCRQYRVRGGRSEPSCSGALAEGRLEANPSAGVVGQSEIASSLRRPAASRQLHLGPLLLECSHLRDGLLHAPRASRFTTGAI